MSASIGQPGHEESGWTHAICDSCWNDRNPTPERNPTRVLDSNDRCCYCGGRAHGIYVRENAKKVHV